MNKALIIYSGGIDSTSCLYWALDNFDEVHTLTFFYHQRHSIETVYAKKATILASNKKNRDIKNHLFEFDLSIIHKNALTDKDIDVPQNRDISKISSDIPATYVAFRNGIFLSIAAALAEANNINNIVGGWNSIDYSGYPDCREEFLESFEKSINYGTKFGTTGGTFKILAPLLKMKKSEIINFGKRHKADFSYSYSCYNGMQEPCGVCDACILRTNAFKEAGYEDDFLVRIAKHKENR